MKRINNKFINKKKKGKLLKYGLTLGLGVIPVIASSCGVSSTLIKNSYIVTGNQFTSNLSLSNIATKSLQSTSGMSAYLKSVVDRILYNWLVNLGNNNSEYKTLLDNQRNSINNSYNDSVKTYKKTHGSNWELKFQQEVLDPNGGTKEAYINSQLYSFARSTFTDKLFSTFFLSVYDTSTNNVQVYPSRDDILNALKNTSGITVSGSNLKFKFDNKVDLTTSADSEPNKSFAAFQDYIYQKYVEYENPYIVDNVQWNYSTPIGSEGINSLYKIPTNSSSGEGDSNSGDSSGDSSSDGSTSSTSSFVTTRSNSTSEATPITDDDSSSGDSGGSDSDSGTTTTTNSGSYAFPYFGNENGTNTSGGTVSKFTKFLNTAISKSNFIETSDTDVGLKNIEKSLTDGDSTLKFVKNSTIFNDQSVEYASAVSYLYGVLGKTNGSSSSQLQLQDISGSIKHDIDLTSTTTNGLDPITSNFISESSLYSTSSGTPSISTLKLDKSYVSNLIQPDGSLSGLSNKDLFVIDNFIPGSVKTTSTSSGTDSLNKFMFFRSSTGVEAASIDGSTLIEKATTVSDKKIKAANVVLYRYFMGNQGYSNFTIDLSSELSTFFSSNIDWLIYQYANESTQTGIDGTPLGRQTMFELSDISVSDQALAKAISFFTPALTYYNNIYSAAEKMYSAKKTYNQNYGYSVYSNGLASNFNYAYGSTDDAKNNYVNPNIFYENVMIASTASNPYVTTSTTKNANTSSGSSNTTSLHAQVLSAINAVVGSINKQDADYNRYTQYLYSNNYYVNAAMTSVLSNTGYVSAEIQNPVLTSYIGNFYSLTSNNNNYNTFNLSTNPFSSSGSTSATDLQNYLQSALYNFFFLSNFTGETNSLFSFGATTNTKNVSSLNTSNNATNLLKNVRDYSWDLWNDKNALDPSTAVSNYNTLYKTIASIKYLLGTDLSNFLQYMRSYIGNEKAYVAWQNSTNTNVGALNVTSGSTYSNPTSQDLVTRTNLSINTNNAIYGNYVGKSPYNGSSSGGSNSNTTANAYNLETNASYQSSVNTSYFSSTSNNLTTLNGSSTNSVNVGFMGLQLSSSNSLPSDVANALFTKPYDYNIGTTGAFYQYTNKDNLKAEVSNIITLANLTTLATNLDTVTNSKYNFSGIINTTKSLNEKKADLNAVIDSMSDNDQLFTQFKNYVGVSTTNNNTTTINSYSSDATSVAKYGTYAIELKASDFNSLSSLQAALGATSTNTNSYKVADEIICNLVVQYASQASNQTNWISNIVGTNKVDIYDIRAYNAISSDGITWVRNFKTISK